jgi:aryl-alcohol dehydrogenase-like predicted oxidoreductase
VASSLAALQTTYIDLYYQHRPDPDVPVEIVLETLRPYVEQGVIKWLGLSECSADVLRRAKAVPGIGEKVVAVQMEYGAFELGHEKSGFLDVAKELGVGLVAYSPLGKGLVSGRYSLCSRHYFFMRALIRGCSIIYLDSDPVPTLSRETSVCTYLVSRRKIFQLTSNLRTNYL